MSNIPVNNCAMVLFTFHSLLNLLSFSGDALSPSSRLLNGHIPTPSTDIAPSASKKDLVSEPESTSGSKSIDCSTLPLDSSTLESLFDSSFSYCFMPSLAFRRFANSINGMLSSSSESSLSF